MAEKSEISWTDSTFNPWIGCSKVSPGCENCYAERDFDHRKGRAKWGAGNPRVRTSASNWNNPLIWQRRHEQFHAEHGRRQRVFCASLGDVFDNDAPEAWRADLIDLIQSTPDLDWLLLTKRIGNVLRMVPEGLPANVWLGATMVNQEEFVRDLPKLRHSHDGIVFVSAEPLLEDIGDVDLSYIDWLIVGGESGPRARPMQEAWVLNLQRQCRRDGVAFHFKQWGGLVPKEGGCLLQGKEFKEFPQ